MCGFYWVVLAEYVLAEKFFLGYTNLFSLNDNKKNEKIIYKYFKDKYVMSNLEFRCKSIDETRNYLIEEIKYNDLISE